MYAVGARGQSTADYSYRRDGSITAANQTKLVTPIPFSRASYLLQNLSATVLWFEFGSARFTASILAGAVNAVAITNGGFGFTAPPILQFLGGAAYDPQVMVGPSGAGLPGYAPPGYLPGNQSTFRPATAVAVLTAGVVTGVTITDPGNGYAFAPYIACNNDLSDRYGCADPFYAGFNSGLELAAGQIFQSNGYVTDMDQIAVFGATSGQNYLYRWMA